MVKLATARRCLGHLIVLEICLLLMAHLVIGTAISLSFSDYCKFCDFKQATCLLQSIECIGKDFVFAHVGCQIEDVTQ